NQEACCSYCKLSHHLFIFFLIIIIIIGWYYGGHSICEFLLVIAPAPASTCCSQNEWLASFAFFIPTSSCHSNLACSSPNRIFANITCHYNYKQCCCYSCNAADSSS